MTNRNEAKAMGQGRIYQAAGDQHITEHHQYPAEWIGPDSVRSPAVGRPPVILRDRAAEMDQLRAAVAPGAGNGVCVIHGLGGCGKTAVAHAVFQHAVNDHGRVGLWVNASDLASLRAGMLAVAADRGASDAELMGARSGLRPAADLVWHYLNSSREPWLLVIDNADTPAILRDGGWLRTSPAGTVVVTSRRAGAHWWPGAQLLHFGVLPRDDAAQVLRDLAPGTGTAEEAAEVADRLGRLPLALILAGGFLAHQVISPWTLSEYRRCLDTSSDLDLAELIDQGSAAVGDNDPRQLVSRTWQLSLDALTEQGLPEATGLLELLSCWADDPLPLSLLSGVDQPAVSLSRLDSALNGLLDQSLTSFVGGPVRCLRTHGVVLDCVAHSITAERRGQIVVSALHLLIRMLPEIPDRGRQDPVVALLAPHVLAIIRRVTGWDLPDSTVEVAATCGLRLVMAIHRSGDYSSALSLATEAGNRLEKRLGSQHVSVLRIRQRVGRALDRLGRYEESESVYRHVLQQYEECLGPEAPETLESCLGLGSSLWPGKKHKAEATALIRRAVDGRVRLLGRLHPLTLRARTYLLECVSAADFKDILGSGPALLADCHTALSANHEITLGAEHNYAWALLYAGEPTEALPHILIALEGYERDFGINHPGVLSAHMAYGMVLAALGRWDEAIAQVEGVIEGRSALQGAGHPLTVWSSEVLEGIRKAQRNSVVWAPIPWAGHFELGGLRPQ